MSPSQDLLNMPSPYSEAHKLENIKGPGDARPTAFQILLDQDLVGKLEGKVALVTGISSGLGIETARALKATGMHVFGAVRNLSKAREALKDDLEPGKLDLITLDNNSLASVRAGAREFLSKSDRLNVLINNAGVMMTPGDMRTDDGFESQFGVNHLAHFLLFQLLKSTLLRSATPEFGSRVVNISSSAHAYTPRIFFENINLEDMYNPSIAYGQSKLANIYMANHIDRLYSSQHLHALSLMPGGIETGLSKYLPKEIMEGWLADEEFMRMWKSPEQGAATQVWAAVGKELEGKGGVYLEDCHVATHEVEGIKDVGYSDAAYDEEAERKLWTLSCKLVGVEE
jgi:NAD(P)-dependent dehydrogenase (short-subunit alcohol dehydrogenase family)